MFRFLYQCLVCVCINSLERTACSAKDSHNRRCVPERYKNLCRCVAICSLLSLVAVNNATFGQDELTPIIEKLNSKDTFARRDARKELAGYLARVHDTNKEQCSITIQRLITSLPKHNYRSRLGIADALSKIKFFWNAGDSDAQKDAETLLYNLYQKEKDSTLKRALDKALMQAAGLYAEAIFGFNYTKVDKDHDECVDSSVEKQFERTFTKYPLSQYASRAHFYLGLYYTHAYFILEERRQNPKLEVCVDKSNEVFQDYLKLADGKYRSRTEHVFDAHFFRALNFVLLNKVDDAINELELIENSKSKEEKIYVYRFYYRDADVVDKYFDARALAKHTRMYLSQHKRTDFHKQENLDKFVTSLLAPHNTEETEIAERERNYEAEIKYTVELIDLGFLDRIRKKLGGKVRTHKFIITVQAKSESPLEPIQKVTYYLHPTFTRSEVTVENQAANFEYILEVWGQFMIRAKVHFNDGEVREISKFLSFTQ